MTVDNIKNYLHDDKKQEFVKLANEIYDITKHLNQTYPGYKEWFFEKQIKEYYTPDRNIIFIKSSVQLYD